MFLISERGRATNSPKPVRITNLRLAVFSISAIFAIIGGPKSPITTKKAIVVPTIYPIIPSSMKSLPLFPKLWKAKFSKFLLLAKRADLSRRWQETYKRHQGLFTSKYLNIYNIYNNSAHLYDHSTEENHDRSQDYSALLEAVGHGQDRDSNNGVGQSYY